MKPEEALRWAESLFARFYEDGDIGAKKAETALRTLRHALPSLPKAIHALQDEAHRVQNTGSPVLADEYFRDLEYLKRVIE